MSPIGTDSCIGTFGAQLVVLFEEAQEVRPCWRKHGIVGKHGIVDRLCELRDLYPFHFSLYFMPVLDM